MIEPLRAAFDFYSLGKMRVSLMLAHGELETISRVFECLSLLINGGSIAMEPIFGIFCPSMCITQICAK